MFIQGEKNTMKKRMLFAVTLIFLVLAAILWGNLFKGDTSLPGMNIVYKIKPENIEEKMISVNIRIYRDKSAPNQDILLAKGLIDEISPDCVDQNGSKIPFGDNGGIKTIGPIPDGVEYIDYSYKTILGEAVHGRIL